MATILRYFLLLAGLAACSRAEEAERARLLVATDGAGLGVVTTDLGYEVELTRAALVASDLRFAIAGEAHTSWLRRLSDSLVPVAHAHPGHYQGGEVTGELPGRFVLSFVTGETEVLGDATLLVGAYQSASLSLSRATAQDVAEDDPLLGHTAVLMGQARRDDEELEFQALIDSPAGRDLVGIRFEHRITEKTSGRLVLRLMTRDPLEGDTLFDGLEFGSLDPDGDRGVSIVPDATDAASVDAYNVLRRTLQTHDHFLVELESP